MGRVDRAGARLAPIVTAGFTDSHYIRKAFGTTVYGFFPLKAMDAQLAARLVHSADERIAVDDLELGVELFRHVALHHESGRWRTGKTAWCAPFSRYQNEIYEPGRKGSRPSFPPT